MRFLISFSSPKYFFSKTKGNHSIGSVLGIVDRSDRIIIAFFLPTIILGQYAVMSGMISFFRFIPDAIAKIIVSGKRFKIGSVNNLKRLLLASALLITFFAILLSQLFISTWLGPEWLLPWYVPFVFALQEFARGGFQLLGNYSVAIGDSARSHKSSIMLVSISIPLGIFFSQIMGIVGVSVGFLASYLLVLFLTMKAKQNV